MTMRRVILPALDLTATATQQHPRLLLLVDELGLGAPPDVAHAYAIVPEGAPLPQVLLALEALRAAGVAVQMHAGGGSMKSQFKRADASGAAYALVFGAGLLITEAGGHVGNFLGADDYLESREYMAAGPHLFAELGALLCAYSRFATPPV